jgi:hypothetical protein
MVISDRASTSTFDSVDPATGELLATLPVCGSDEIDAAVESSWHPRPRSASGCSPGSASWRAFPPCWRRAAVGLMAALELDVDDAGERADRICAGGVIVRATGQQLVLSPPFVIEDDDLDRLVEVIGHKLARPPAKPAA